MMNTQKENPSTTTANEAPPPPPPPQYPPPRGGRPTCTACRYEGRACTVNCPYAPYFPANMKTKDFHNVLRLFGLNNVNKILNMVPEHRRDDAMTSIIYEANMRAAIPAGGCTTVIAVLRQQIAHCENELQLVAKYIDIASADAGLSDAG